jgi:hypothetical protein
MLNKLIDNKSYLEELEKFKFQMTMIKNQEAKTKIENLLKQLQHNLKILDEAHNPRNTGLLRPDLLTSKREIVNTLRKQIKDLCKQHMV